MRGLVLLALVGLFLGCTLQAVKSEEEIPDRDIDEAAEDLSKTISQDTAEDDGDENDVSDDNDGEVQLPDRDVEELSNRMAQDIAEDIAQDTEDFGYENDDSDGDDGDDSEEKYDELEDPRAMDYGEQEDPAPKAWFRWRKLKRKLKRLARGNARKNRRSRRIGGFRIPIIRRQF